MDWKNIFEKLNKLESAKRDEIKLAFEKALLDWPRFSNGEFIKRKNKSTCSKRYYY